MLRKNSSTFGSRRLKGIINIIGQCLGGLLAAFLSLLIGSFHTGDIHVRPVESKMGSSKYYEACISEMTGSFVFVFLFMLCTDKKTQFSNDKVINCFIISSAYVAARLIGGGQCVTMV